jgi:hypothetical protein
MTWKDKAIKAEKALHDRAATENGHKVKGWVDGVLRCQECGAAVVLPDGALIAHDDLNVRPRLWQKCGGT